MAGRFDRECTAEASPHCRRRRREIRRLAAIATERAAEAETRGLLKSRQTRGASFRPLCEAEAEEIVGAELLAQVAAAAGRA
jgi:hypothetical protein